jgi:sarcosine oxidase
MHDVIVVGLGAMGSAALYHLARRNLRVLGIDRFEPGHERGSSHGRTRIIRKGYFEHPSYVPLVQRAYRMWRELERDSGQSLLTITGIAEIGVSGSTLVTGTLAASREHGLPHEVMAAQDFSRRYPAFRLPPDFVAVVQPDGGFVEADAGIRAHLRLAVAAGAEIRTGEQVLAIDERKNCVTIRTERGVIEAGRVIVTAGAWTTSLFPKLSLPLRPTRQVLLWMRPDRPELFKPGWFPVFMIESADGIHYGFPLHDELLKLAKHHHANEIADPDSYSRVVSKVDEDVILGPLARLLPAARGPVAASKTCLYTMAPHEDFVIDCTPGFGNVIVASPCSGHGFKFAPVIGQILTAMATGAKPAFDLRRFALDRLREPLPEPVSAQ